MVGGSPVAVALLCAALVFAGCLGGDGGGKAEVDDGDAPKLPSKVTSGAAVEQPATLDGVVTDAAKAPVSGARLTLEGVNLTLSAASDDKGKFAFDGLPNGTFELLAEKTGFETAQMPIVLKPGEKRSVEFELVALAVAVPLTFNTTVFDGNIGCGAAVHRPPELPPPLGQFGGTTTTTPCGTLRDATNHVTDFRLTATPGVTSVLAEIVWAPNPSNGATALIGNLDTPITGNTFSQMRRAEGASPLRMNISAGERGIDETFPANQATDNKTWRVTVGLSDEAGSPVEVIRDQAYTVYVTLFWGTERPSANFTAVK